MPAEFVPRLLLSAALAIAVTGAVRADDKPLSKPRLVGTASCAAAACHGGLTKDGIVGAEYATWVGHDPHARAYSVLHNELSQRMAKELKLPKPAHESAVCLNCHSPATTAVLAASESHEAQTASAVVPREFPPFEGVGCEQCHGAAEHWLTPHVRLDWKQRSHSDKAALGFRDLKDVLTRARQCVECHVGEAGRDVNHDLIAAGHPRLFFELSAFHANMPVHWRRDADFKRHSFPAQQPATGESKPKSGDAGSYFEAKLWSVGQVAVAEKSLRLLSQRAALAQADSKAAWPELAEWNCFACHHDLQSASWRQTLGSGNRKAGQTALSSWNYSAIELLAPVASSTSSGEKAQAALQRVRQRMAVTFPSAADVQREADLAADEFRAWSEQLNQPDVAQKLFASESLDRITHRLAKDFGPKRIVADWDSATQVFLAFSALHATQQTVTNSADDAAQQRSREFSTVLESMNETLNFPQGFQSPRTFAVQPIERLQNDLTRLEKLFAPGND